MPWPPSVRLAAKGRSVRGRAEALLLVVVVGWLGGCRTAAPPPAPQRLPDPAIAPPGFPPLSVAQSTAARKAIGAAERGDAAGARALLARLPAAHPSRRLLELELRFVGGENVLADAARLGTELPNWSAPWQLAALSGRRGGELARALEAARQAASLEPGSAALLALVHELEGAMVAESLVEVRARLERGEAVAALARAEQGLEAVPEAVELRLVAVQAALAAGRTERAAALSPALPDSPDALAVKAAVAGALGQWELAVALYERLPAGYPGRCERLAEARRALRLANAPPAVARALAAAPLTRRGLAVLLLWEVPTLVNFAQGPVPVFEDIVELPERGDILAVARAGVLRGDPVARKFGPYRSVSALEVVAVVERVASVLGTPAPRWCNGEAVNCTRLETPVSGAEVAAILRRLASAGEEPCR